MSFLFSQRQSTRDYSSLPLDDHIDDIEVVEADTDDELIQDGNIQNETQAENPAELPPLTVEYNSLTYCQSVNSFIHRRAVILGIVGSIFALITFSSILSGLGYYSVFVKKPAPYIDKSYHAFAIPNHEASRHYDAFTVARSKNSSRTVLSYRHKRDTNYQNIVNQYLNFKNIDFSNFGNIPKDLLSYSGPNQILNFNDLTKKGHYPELTSSKIQKRSIRNIEKRSSSDMLTIMAYQYHVRWKMQVVFLATGNDDEPEHEKDNIFTKERLKTIHDIEKSILDHPKFKDFCFKDIYIFKNDPAIKSINGCAPLNSLMTYFYPSQDSSGKFHYDGLGSNMAEIESAIKLAMTSDHFYYFVDEKVNKTYHKSRLLRTEVLFGAPLKGYSNPYVKSDEQTEKFKSFVVEYIDILSKASTDKVQVLYGGNEIFDYEVDSTFWNDLKLAIISAVMIAVFMLMLTSSIWLTLWGIVSICLSFPLAFFFYRVVCGIRALGILNGVAAFVIIGIGVDDVFVFVNIFRQSSHDKPVFHRIKYTLVTAGKATFFTSFTTAAAFAANLASSIPAVHQFGLFMSLIVACCWVTVVLIMPPALFIWQLSFAKCENYIMSICTRPFKHFKTTLLDLPADITQFIRGQSISDCPSSPSNNIDIPQGQGNVHSDVNNQDDEDDLPLLMLEDPMEYYFQAQYDTDDVPLLTGDDNNHQQMASQTNSSNHTSSKFLQSCVYHVIARPVIKIRLVILGLSVLILLSSIALATFLHPATKPPQIFDKDTNLQKVLDLKANLSVIDDVSCSKCSAVYDVGGSHKSVPEPKFPRTERPPQIPKQWFTQRQTNSPIYVTPAKSTVNPTMKSTKNSKALFPPWKLPPTKPKPPKTTKKSMPTTTTKRTTTKTTRPTTRITTTTHWPFHKMSHLFPITNQPTTKPLIITPPRTPSESSSVPLNVDLCKNNDCSKAQDRPLLETGATVFVVFGIKGIDRSGLEVGHVMDDSTGRVVFDEEFSRTFQIPFKPEHLDKFAKLCRICKLISSHTELVRNGSAQCFPTYLMPPSLKVLPDCRDLPEQGEVYGRLPPAHAVGGLNYNNTALLWWAFAFESTTSKGQSYFGAFKQYLKWEKLIQDIKDTELKDVPHLGLNSMFQTSEFWEKVVMEIVAVNSAIYGLVLSLIICLAAVAIFTGHVILLLIIFFSIVEMICLVLGIFYLVGWEIGGVEAVSLSILVGSSVDYCMHLVEGYLIAGKAMPSLCKETKAKGRQWRTKAALSHIGVSIISSALTTIVASIPLTQTIIQPFSKFGQIVAINTSVCIFYSLTVCTGFLAAVAPAYFVPTWKSYVKATLSVIVCVSVVTLSLFVATKAGAFIPGPNGNPLFG